MGRQLQPSDARELLMTDEANLDRVIQLLSEIRDNQKTQMLRQAEILGLQREHLALMQKQSDRAERLQERAEHLQAKSAELVIKSRKALSVIMPVVLLLIVYVSWLLFR